MPWLQVAIERNNRDMVELAWLKGHNQETRSAALRFLLQPQTECLEGYEALLDEISREVELRKAEVQAARRR